VVRLPGPFDHGYARNFALAWARDRGFDVIVFLTQDAIPVGEKCIEKLIEPLGRDQRVKATTGRQLPRSGATPCERATRLAMYPRDSGGRDLLGLHSTSNAFAAYDIEVLSGLGGFPSPALFGEDVAVSQLLTASGWSVAYVPEACCEHSHPQTLMSEIRRQFDAAASGRLGPMTHTAADHARILPILRAELNALSPRSIRVLGKWVYLTSGRATGQLLGRCVRVLPRRVANALSSAPHVMALLRR
jgi:hypothetical protein